MKQRFIDTWFWETLIVGTEPFNKTAVEFFSKYYYQGDQFYTSGSVIAETTNAILFSKSLIKAPETKLRPEYAFKFFEKFKAALEDTDRLEILTATPAQISEALELLKANFRAIPKLSYFDCESLVLSKANQIPSILTGDSDFDSLGLPMDEDWKLFMEKSSHDPL
jgi:predicted nucleic acid-binding protein